MISALLRAARERFDNPGTVVAMVAAGVAVLGSLVVQNYARQVQAELAESWKQVRLAAAEKTFIQGATGVYPAREDTDPLDRGDHEAHEDQADELVDELGVPELAKDVW